MFGNIPIVRMKVEIPKASAKRLEKKRFVVVEGDYVHWDNTQRIMHKIPEGVDVFEFDFKDESDDNEDVYDGKISYSFYLEFHNETSTRIERIKVDPVIERQV